MDRKDIQRIIDMGYVAVALLYIKDLKLEKEFPVVALIQFLIDEGSALSAMHFINLYELQMLFRKFLNGRSKKK